MHTMSPNHDLEAYLFQDDNRQGNRNRGSQNNHVSTEAVPNSMTNLQNTLNFSLKFNSIKLLISFAKIIASIVVFVTSTVCMDNKAVWILLMLADDVMNSIVTIITIRLVRKVNRELEANVVAQQGGGQRQRPGHRDSLRETQLAYGQGYDINNEDMDERAYRDRERQNRNVRALAFARQTAERQQVINIMTSAVETLYLILFVYGQIIFFMENDPQCFSKPVENLLLAYLIMAYIWVLSPIAMVILACLCLPVFMIFFHIFGTESPMSANKILIDSLEVKDFTQDLPGNHECTICMVDYKEQDKIVQFKCSPMHHFHEACIKRWLGINGQCPICRMRVEEMGMQQDDVV